MCLPHKLNLLLHLKLLELLGLNLITDLGLLLLQTFLVALTALQSLQAVADLVAKRLFSCLDFICLFLYLDVLVVEHEDRVKIKLLT